MESVRHERCVIIGSGPAGYTAAIYAARALLKPVLICGVQVGGQLTITADVENYPGFVDVIQGPWLMKQMRGQAAHVGTEIIQDTVVSVNLRSRPYSLVLDSGISLETETLIIATGAQAKWLGIESEARYQGLGVSACATCDGFFFRGKEVVVVGGGNTAVEEALFLTKFADRITVVHRRLEFRAEAILQERLFANPKISVLWNHEIDEILGDREARGVTGIRLRDIRSGKCRHIACHGVFIAIGHAPASALFAGQLEMDESGYLRIQAGSAATALKGVFAAGDVTDDVYRQAVTAAGMGCMAALEAVRLLAEEDHQRSGHPLTHQESAEIAGW
jgi:thioredoxin reductase (NADPH)